MLNMMVFSVESAPGISTHFGERPCQFTHISCDQARLRLNLIMNCSARAHADRHLLNSSSLLISHTQSHFWTPALIGYPRLAGRYLSLRCVATSHGHLMSESLLEVPVFLLEER